MFHLVTILHPTDFSRASACALDLACSLARDHGGRVIVLHVAEPPLVAPGGGVVPLPPGGVWQAIKDRLGEVRPADARIPIEHRLVEGKPADEILRMAQENKYDLIVMGSHGLTGLRHLLMGSVAEQVVRRAPCPVVVVKAPLLENAQTS